MEKLLHEKYLLKRMDLYRICIYGLLQHSQERIWKLSIKHILILRIMSMRKIAYDKFAIFLPILDDYAYKMNTNCFRACKHVSLFKRITSFWNNSPQLTSSKTFIIIIFSHASAKYNAIDKTLWSYNNALIQETTY